MTASTIKQDLFNLPNLITMTRIVAIPFVLVLVDIATPAACYWAAASFGFAGATDYLDGWLARKMGLVSLTGKFLDPLADKLMVMACLIQLTSMGWLSAWIPILLLTRELSIQGLRQIASAEGMVIEARQGGKWKTAFQMVGIIALLAHFEFSIDFILFKAQINFHRVGWWLVLLSIAFSYVSAWQYFIGFLRSIKPGAK